MFLDTDGATLYYEVRGTGPCCSSRRAARAAPTGAPTW